MNVSIVKEDRMVMVDGKGLNFDFTLADNIWAIQWNGLIGTIEFNDGTPNQEINSFVKYQYLVDNFNIEKDRLVKVAKQEEINRIANMTYVDKRREAYPTLEDQADMAYWDRQNGTTNLDDALTAVKEQYPKPTEG